MQSLEQLIQIFSIVVFLATAIGFFVKIGEYKSVINAKMASIEIDMQELKDEYKTLKNDISKLKNDTNTTVVRIETLLIEVKTKLELLMQFSGLNTDAKFKK